MRRLALPRVGSTNQAFHARGQIFLLDADALAIVANEDFVLYQELGCQPVEPKHPDTDHRQRNQIAYGDAEVEMDGLTPWESKKLFQSLFP